MYQYRRCYKKDKAINNKQQCNNYHQCYKILFTNKYYSVHTFTFKFDWFLTRTLITLNCLIRRYNQQCRPLLTGKSLIIDCHRLPKRRMLIKTEIFIDLSSKWPLCTKINIYQMVNVSVLSLFCCFVKSACLVCFLVLPSLKRSCPKSRVCVSFWFC